MKKIIVILILNFLIVLCSCQSKGNNGFISDENLKHYGVEKMSDIVSSEVFYTEEYGSRISSYLYYNNDIEFQTLLEDVYEMLLNDELYSYCGYISPTEIMKASNKIITRSTKLEEHYINDNDMDEDGITLTSCIFVYMKIGDENIYELEITSQPEVKVINGQEFNVVINLAKRSFYICE